MQSHGVVARALEVLEIAAAADVPRETFTEAEHRYAASKSDPERRLAARLAAKRAALTLLGEGLGTGDIEIRPARGGPPRLSLSPAAEARLRERGARTTLVSLTHGREYAAAVVLLLAADA